MSAVGVAIGRSPLSGVMSKQVSEAFQKFTQSYERSAATPGGLGLQISNFFKNFKFPSVGSRTTQAGQNTITKVTQQESKLAGVKGITKNIAVTTLAAGGSAVLLSPQGAEIVDTTGKALDVVADVGKFFKDNPIVLLALVGLGIVVVLKK